MKITYSNRNHCWIISQIQIKLLSSGDKAKHNFFRFVLASKFSFFLSFFFSFNEVNRSKKGAEEESRCTKKNCVARKNRLCSDLPYFTFANDFICFCNSLVEGIISQ